MKKLTEHDGKSLDVVNENLETLKAIFPEVFTEDGVNFEVLRQLLGDAVDEGEEKYGLNWFGKKKARQIALTPSLGTLRPCPEESVDWDTTQNLFIEGDNLEVLKLLQKSYANKVKMIYIDPPYNTGKEFIYPDKFQDNLDTYLKYTGQKDDNGFKLSSNTESSGRYHTNWLNMMYPRLKLAKSLLKHDGSIFVSIDDNEQSNLKSMCDEIFGEDNFVSNIAWQKVFAKKNKALVSGSHDHILLYVKNIDSWVRNLLPRSDEQLSAFKNPDNDLRGKWQSVSFSVQSEDANKRASYRYLIKLPSGREVPPPAGRHWNGLPDKYEELKADNRIWYGQDGDNPPREKVFLSEVQSGIVPDTWWDHKATGNNQEAKKEIIDLFGNEEPFSTPKPTRLIKRMLQIASVNNDSDIIMDFFAGSCTTAHSVFSINADDSGNRKFVMVQLPEPTKSGKFTNIAEIGKERIRCAANKIKEESSLHKGDLGFKVFKLDSSNIRAWNPDRSDLEQTLIDHMDHLIEGRSEDDILYELLLKRGVDLTASIEQKTITGKTVYSIGHGILFTCLDTAIGREEVEDLSHGIIAWRDEHNLDESAKSKTQVVFRDSAFANDIAKTNMTAILQQHGITHVRSL